MRDRARLRTFGGLNQGQPLRDPIYVTYPAYCTNIHFKIFSSGRSNPQNSVRTSNGALRSTRQCPTPCVCRSIAYSHRNVVLPNPAPPVKTVNSRRRNPPRYLLSTSKRFHYKRTQWTEPTHRFTLAESLTFAIVGTRPWSNSGNSDLPPSTRTSLNDRNAPLYLTGIASSRIARLISFLRPSRSNSTGRDL